MSLYPDYSRMGVDAGAFPYEFSYNVKLTCGTKISNLSIPQHAEVVSQNETGTEVEIHSNRPGKKMSMYWRTKDMLHPQLVYSKNTKTNEIACVASLVPTFEPVEP